MAQPHETDPRKKPGAILIPAALGVMLAMAAVSVFIIKNELKGPAPTARTTVAQAPATISKPAPGLSAARKAQMSDQIVTTPASETAKAGSTGPTRPVHLITNPAEADVTVDGRREATCKSPCTADLSDGIHTLVAKKEGYRSTLQNFQVGAEDDEVTVSLNPVTGSLTLRTDPAGAAIAVDGNARAEVTPSTLALPVGKYRVRLTHSGFAPYEVETVVLPESAREISVRLAK